MKKREPIDFVITWVDGNDPKWKSQRSKYNEETGCDNRDVLYRNWELLRYWFRGIEAFAPWVRKIHFVTEGHLPEWLDINHPKLNIVRHEDFIPEEYLPTFNSNAIEIFLYRIKDLAEQFVYFNDDVFVINDVNPEDFFVKGKPCDMLAFQPVVANRESPVMSHIYLNNSLVIAKYFDKRENVKKQPEKYFKIGYPPLYFFYNFLELAFPRYTGFYTVHGTHHFCKRTFNELWQKEPEVLIETASQKFRSKHDISLYLFREWQKLTGNFYEKNVTKDLAYFDVGANDKKLIDVLVRQKKKILCINDTHYPIEFEITKKRFQKAFQKILPEKSSFEL